MAGLVVFISLTLLAACRADTAEAPITCGVLPPVIYRCLGTPNVVKPGVAANCDKDLSECEKLTCIFRHSGWMDGDKVDKLKLAAHFDQFAADNPAWQPAVDNLKTACLQGDLPPQGIHLNCPAYDAMQCTFGSFIKYAQPSQWSTAPSCSRPRQFAAACPICPSSCFAPQIPIGSCNACLSLPRSP